MKHVPACGSGPFLMSIVDGSSTHVIETRIFFVPVGSDVEPVAKPEIEEDIEEFYEEEDIEPVVPVKQTIKKEIESIAPTISFEEEVDT